MKSALSFGGSFESDRNDVEDMLPEERIMHVIHPIVLKLILPVVQQALGSEFKLNKQTLYPFLALEFHHDASSWSARIRWDSDGGRFVSDSLDLWVHQRGALQSHLDEACAAANAMVRICGWHDGSIPEEGL